MCETSKQCPDGGVCGHGCESGGGCFRVIGGAPISGIFPGDRWPADVEADHRLQIQASEEAEKMEIAGGAPLGCVLCGLPVNYDDAVHNGGGPYEPDDSPPWCGPAHRACRDLWEGLDSGIRALVFKLKRAGFKPVDSGDGLSKIGGPMDGEGGCVLPFAHVFCDLEGAGSRRKEARRALRLLEAWGFETDPQKPGSWSVQASYSPRDDSLILEICQSIQEEGKAAPVVVETCGALDAPCRCSAGYLIFSFRRRAWWKDGGAGYAADRRLAGVFPGESSHVARALANGSSVVVPLEMLGEEELAELLARSARS